MENRRAIMLSLLAAGAAILFYVLSIRQAVQNRVGDLEDKKEVVYALQDIPVDTEITQQMIARKLWPINFDLPEVARSESEILRPRQKAVATIKQGEPIMLSKLLPMDEGTIQTRIPAGMRAVTIGIRDDQDVVGVAGLIRPGHFVDILTTLFVSTKEIERGGLSAASVLNQQNDNLKAEVRTIFQHIPVIAVGRDARLFQAGTERSNLPGEENLANKNVTVVLSPSDAQKLVLAQQVGRITLTLRPMGETKIVEDLDYTDPFRAFGIKLPVVQGPPPAYREIRGGQVVAAPF